MKRLIVALLAIIAAVLPTHAQTSEQVVPVDTALRQGVLPNGMTYYVRKALQKKHIGEFRLVQRTGSLVETDTELGMAHFLEHMMFKGTKHYPGNTIIDFLRSIGVAFGPDVNARTSFENTLYILSDVPLTGESRIDSCLMILRDWSADAIIDAAALNAERNVIVEEWRARSMGDDGMKLFKERNAGTQYAERNPIGSMDIINTCTADQMRAFYKRWYQPQNQCVIACGDFNPDLMVKKIEKLFGDLKKGSTTVPEFHLLTDTEQPFIAVTQSKQVPMAVIQLTTLYPSMPQSEMQKVAFFKQNEINNIVIQILRSRMDKLKSENPQVVLATVSQVKPIENYSIKANQALASLLTSVTDWREILKQALTEVEKVKRIGVTDEELSKYISYKDSSDFRAIEDTTVIEWNDTLYGGNSDVVDAKGAAENCIEHYLKGTIALSPKVRIILDSYNRRHISRSMVQKAAQTMFDKTHCSLFILFPENNDTALPTKEEVLALWNEVEAIEFAVDNAVPVDEKKEKKQFDISPKPGKVVKKNVLAYDKSFTEYTLSNGVKVVMNTKPDNNTMMTEARLFVKGGETLLENDEAIYSEHLKKAIRNYNEYEQAVPMIKVNPTEVLYGAYADSAQLENMFKSLHVRLTTTDIDTTEYRKLDAQTHMAVEMQMTPLMKALIDIMSFPYASNERLRMPTKEEVAAMSISKMKEILTRLHANYNGMVAVVQTNQTPATVLPLIEKYLGSLPAKKEAVERVDRMEQHYRTNDTISVQTVDGDTPKADCTILLAWEKGLTYDASHQAHMDALRSVLNEAFINRIRLQHSDIYSIGVQPKFTQHPFPQMLFTISFVCNPEKEAVIRNDIKALLKEMTDKGIDEQLLENFKSLKRKNRKAPSLNKGKSADDIREYFIHDGIVIDTNDLALYDAITVDSLKDFLSRMLTNGNILEYVLKTVK
ncbi:MAG: insulinase family protein [Bacteroidaceae bacterium]|nr:insulinase family protein [Bacteroidaceae bacterium]